MRRDSDACRIGFSYVAGTLRVPTAARAKGSRRLRVPVTARGACLLHGFTLVELLVVIAIIGILVALLLPAIQAARESARRSRCENNLKQMGLALQGHHDATQRFPMGRNGRDQYSVSWAYYLLPYLEEDAVSRAFVDGERVDDEVNAQAMRTPIEVYACPSRRTAAADRNFDDDDNPPRVLAAAALGDYAANAGLRANTGMQGEEVSSTGFDKTVAGPLFTQSVVSARHVVDGMVHTLAVGERHIPPRREGFGPEWEHFWMGDTAFLAGDTRRTVLAGTMYGLAHPGQTEKLVTDPAEDNWAEEMFGSVHTDVVQFVFLDGHVAAVSLSIDLDTLKALSTIGGSEPVAY
jgi:prepilin-type N-terminal cleavage/methylation domain-containing protein